MFRRLYVNIRFRFDEMLSGAETVRLLESLRKSRIFPAVQADAPVEHQISSTESSSVVSGQGSGISNEPQTDRLLAAAKKDDLDTDVLAEVFFLNKSVF